MKLDSHVKQRFKNVHSIQTVVSIMDLNMITSGTHCTAVSTGAPPTCSSNLLFARGSQSEKVGLKSVSEIELKSYIKADKDHLIMLMT